MHNSQAYTAAFPDGNIVGVANCGLHFGTLLLFEHLLSQSQTTAPLPQRFDSTPILASLAKGSIMKPLYIQVISQYRAKRPLKTSHTLTKSLHTLTYHTSISPILVQTCSEFTDEMRKVYLPM